MKNKNEGYPFLHDSRLRYKYKCISCGAYVKRGTKECYRCFHEFSPDDVNHMIEHYRSNYAQNWRHKIYFILFMLFVLALLGFINN